MPSRDYQYDEDTMKLRVNCLGYIYGASIEDFEDLMARVMDIILEIKKVSTIVLVKEREYEYDSGQTEILVEIANLLEELIRGRIISYTGGEKCLRCYPQWNSVLQHIVLGLLRKDPIGAYVETLREIRHIKVKASQTTSKEFYACYEYYLKVLNVIKRRMEKTKLITAAKPHISGYHIGDRTIYRHIFMPNIRPNFMLTRYMIKPPDNGLSLDRYKIGETEVEIFSIPHTAQNMYFVIPPEFKLSDEAYAVLDSARRYMATHKPKTAEFVKSSRIREVFFNIGRDMIKDTADRMAVHLTVRDLDRLATILTRYTAGFGILEVLLADTKIQDLYINSPIEKEAILIFHEDWEECKTNLIPTMEDAEAWATRLRIQSGRPLDESNPILDTDITIPGGSARFAVITRSLSPHGLGFAVRRHRDKPWTLPLFIKNKMINPMAAGLLSFLIDGAVSILVAGGRSSGKTSMLGSLMIEILPKIRIISIEDTLELPVMQLRELGYNIESLKSRSVITRVETEMPADEALRTALRLGDSAMVVGEVRSTEAKALYEAMRIGALSNVVAGTIHGESAYGVFDRVVNDLGVPPTSFKATDIIPIVKALKSADGLHRFRRMTEITEVRKEWDKNPLKEGGFINLMEYSSKEDSLKPTDTLLNGESEIINRIASNVKEWSGDWDAVWNNILLRGKVKEFIANTAEKSGNQDLLEAPAVVKANQRFHTIMDQIRKEIGYPEPERVYKEWMRWYTGALKKSAEAGL